MFTSESKIKPANIISLVTSKYSKTALSFSISFIKEVKNSTTAQHFKTSWIIFSFSWILKIMLQSINIEEKHIINYE